jgi:hypothetical protein
MLRIRALGAKPSSRVQQSAALLRLRSVAADGRERPLPTPSSGKTANLPDGVSSSR